MARFTSVEQWLDDRARELLARRPDGRFARFLVGFVVFVAKQAWASLFGALLLVAIVVARLAYPQDAALERNDALTIVAVVIQLGMILGRLETRREVLIILIFHLVGTGMELFKTDVGSWQYEEGGLLRIAGVPLFTGFMYAAVGSYLARVVRLFDLRFTRYPPLWATGVLALAAYVNFFTHHYVFDVRGVLVVAIVLLYARTMMQVRVVDGLFRMPVLLAFLGVALFIWFAENIGTWGGAWIYPDQEGGWRLVSIAKLVAWFLLMQISVVLVTLVHRPQPPEGEERRESEPRFPHRDDGGEGDPRDFRD